MHGNHRMKAPLATLDRYRHGGLLLLRLGLGGMFMAHGLNKLFAGPETWTQVGSAVGIFGIGEAHGFFGLLAACTETLGGALLALGLFFRFACIGLAAVMIVALTMHFNAGDDFVTWSQPAELLIVLAGLFFVGPGYHSLDNRLQSRQVAPKHDRSRRGPRQQRPLPA